MYVSIGVVVAVLAFWLAWSFFSNNVEQAPYEVLERKGSYEIRRYAPHLVIETTVQSDFDSAINEGFSILASFIFGNNTAQESIAMTAPVIQQKSRGEKIAMTAPVVVEEKEGLWTVQFVVPQKYTRDTLPKPNDPRITVRELPSERVAAYTFGGWFRGSRVEERKEHFLNILRKDGVGILGEARFAGYNAPWTFPLLIRNEILVPIQD